jgi:hypothetical protein
MSASAPTFLLPFLAALAQSFMRASGDLLVNSISENSPELQQRQNTKFLITGIAKSTNSELSATVSGKDPYLLTAIIIAGVAEFLAKKSAQNLGAVSPSMVASAELIRKLTSQAGAVWTL